MWPAITCNTGFLFFSWGYKTPNPRFFVVDHEHLARCVFSWRWQHADFWSCGFIVSESLGKHTWRSTIPFLFLARNGGTNTNHVSCMVIRMPLDIPSNRTSLSRYKYLHLRSLTMLVHTVPWEKFLPDRIFQTQHMLYGWRAEESLVESLLWIGSIVFYKLLCFPSYRPPTLAWPKTELRIALRNPGIWKKEQRWILTLNRFETPCDFGLPFFLSPTPLKMWFPFQINKVPLYNYELIMVVLQMNVLQLMAGVPAYRVVKRGIPCVAYKPPTVDSGAAEGHWRCWWPKCAVDGRCVVTWQNCWEPSPIN